jgi:hypothetical protein
MQCFLGDHLTIMAPPWLVAASSAQIPHEFRNVLDGRLAGGGWRRSWGSLLQPLQPTDDRLHCFSPRRYCRPAKPGRRNWTFLGSDNGGRTAAVLTSLIATCKRHRIDPFAYLRDVFQRIGAHPITRLADLLPDKWLAARSTAA